MQMIPISEIDKLIEHHEGHGISIDYALLQEHGN